MTAALAHPRVAELLGVVWWEQHALPAGPGDAAPLRAPLFTVLELGECSLARRLDAARAGGAPLTPAVVGRLLLDGTQALLAIHKAGHMHRDVKPANLIVFRDADGAERLKAADLGLARGVDATRITLAAGTPRYLAPEAAATISTRHSARRWTCMRKYKYKNKTDTKYIYQNTLYHRSTRNKLLEQRVHLANRAAGHSRPGTNAYGVSAVEVLAVRDVPGLGAFFARCCERDARA